MEPALLEGVLAIAIVADGLYIGVGMLPTTARKAAFSFGIFPKQYRVVLYSNYLITHVIIPFNTFLEMT